MVFRLLLVRPLGCLQRIDLLRRFLDLDFNVGRRRAFPRLPFGGWIGIYAAVLSCRALNDLAASLTLFDDRQASAAVESTTLLGHEAALDAAFDSLTNHDTLLFKIIISIPKKTTRLQTMFMAKSGRWFPFLKSVPCYQNVIELSSKKCMKKCMKK